MKSGEQSIIKVNKSGDGSRVGNGERRAGAAPSLRWQGAVLCRWNGPWELHGRAPVVAASVGCSGEGSGAEELGGG